jgi:FAD/FMN-containing dehydrogenase
VNKVAHYLQQHLDGEVLVSPDVLDHFSHDESILNIRPLLVAHPRNENDLRKAARFSWQLSERGRVVPITIRGRGTDQTGASIGSGVILSTPAHMNKIIELDPKSGSVTVQSGIRVDKLQQTLHTHGRFLPSLQEVDYATIGGCVANNDAGPDSYKYGPLREHVTGTRTILANGELIRTERITKRELNKKLGLASFEGEIYRSLDTLIEDSQDTIEAMRQLGDRSNVGYALYDVKTKDGSFDLTPLLVGSQGTLGLISEINLATNVHSPQMTMLAASYKSYEEAFSAVTRINEMKHSPTVIDFIDTSVIEFVQSTNPSLYKRTLGLSKPRICFFIYSEEGAGKFGKRSSKKLLKILEETNADITEVSEDDRGAWDATRTSPSMFVSSTNGAAKPLPIINDALVPIEKCADFIVKAKEIITKYTDMPLGIWGQAGSGIIYATPMFDITTVGDRQKIFKLTDEYYSLVASMGGTIAARSAEGRLRSSQVHKVMTTDMIEMMQQIKKIFDPFGILNPGVKISGDVDAMKNSLIASYENPHRYSHIAFN